MDRWERRFSLLHEEWTRDSYTGRNKHLETPHILRACCSESSQRPISSQGHLKTLCQAPPQVTKNWHNFHSLWLVSPYGISELAQPWLFPHNTSLLQQDQCQEELTIGKCSFPAADWIYLAYWVCQGVFRSWRNRLERSKKAAVVAKTWSDEVQNPTQWISALSL